MKIHRQAHHRRRSVNRDKQNEKKLRSQTMLAEDKTKSVIV
jgi:hypothetical protein